MKKEKIRDDFELPIIDLGSSNRIEASKQIVKACEELGFFKVINHGVSQQIITRMDEEAREFFSKPGSDKQRAGPANPYGYGRKNIGLKGDVGEVEYLLLQTNPSCISDKSKSISHNFSCAAIEYVEGVKELACEILDLMVKGLGGPDPDPESVLSGLIRDTASDSVLRFNHYPPSSDNFNIGFGEHTDPQILTLLRSNGVEGLQISVEDGVWVPVNPLPHSAFCVNVGDLLQAMTNGRFISVKHRVVVYNTNKGGRMSMGYFAAPPLHAAINNNTLKGLGLEIPEKPVYSNFTWAEYKKATYTCKLGDARLNLFKL